MFKNLMAEMVRNAITNEDIGKYLDITSNTVSSKMLNKTEFTRKEMWEIRQKFFPNLTIEYLFELSTSEK